MRRRPDSPKTMTWFKRSWTKSFDVTVLQRRPWGVQDFPQVQRLHPRLHRDFELRNGIELLERDRSRIPERVELRLASAAA
jgi:hypothetical protein